MSSHILDTKELGIFLKYNYTSNFEENDVNVISEEEFINWIKPQDIEFKPKSAVIDGEECFNYTVNNLPISVLNAWGYKIFNIPNTKVVMNLSQFEKQKAVRMIDRSIQELASQTEQSYKASSIIDKQTHIDTLVEVLRMLQNDNESLFGVNIHVTIYLYRFSHRVDYQICAEFFHVNRFVVAYRRKLCYYFVITCVYLIVVFIR